MNIRNHSLALLAALSLPVAALFAAPQTFDFKDPKGVNNIQFHLDAPLESISGSGNGVTGSVSFDPANPAATTGSITLATATLTVGNPMMKEHLHSATWMDVAGHAEITFTAEKLANVKTTGNKTTADLTGKLSVKGVTKEVTVPVTLTYLADKLGDRVPNTKGDLLVLRSTFSINRSDYGINAGKYTDKVSEEVQISLSLAGASAK